MWFMRLPVCLDSWPCLATTAHKIKNTVCACVCVCERSGVLMTVLFCIRNGAGRCAILEDSVKCASHGVGVRCVDPNLFRLLHVDNWLGAFGGGALGPAAKIELYGSSRDAIQSIDRSLTKKKEKTIKIFQSLEFRASTFAMVLITTLACSIAFTVLSSTGQLASVALLSEFQKSWVPVLDNNFSLRHHYLTMLWLQARHNSLNLRRISSARNCLLVEAVKSCTSFFFWTVNSWLLHQLFFVWFTPHSAAATSKTPYTAAWVTLRAPITLRAP